MIAAEIREDDYRVVGSWTAFLSAGEFGPLACGCCIVVTKFDPVGPCLVLLVQRKDAAEHVHDLTDFGPCGAQVKVVA